MLSNVKLLRANFDLILVRLHQLPFIFNQIISDRNLPYIMSAKGRGGKVRKFQKYSDVIQLLFQDYYMNS